MIMKKLLNSSKTIIKTENRRKPCIIHGFLNFLLKKVKTYDRIKKINFRR